MIAVYAPPHKQITGDPYQQMAVGELFADADAQ